MKSAVLPMYSKKHGVTKGDRVVLYMPMTSEAAISMLACARELVRCTVWYLVVSHQTHWPAGLKTVRQSRDYCRFRHARWQADSTERKCRCGTPRCRGTESVQNVIVVHRTGNPIELKEGRDLWYHMEIMSVNEICPPEPMNAEDPLFILYTFRFNRQAQRCAA